MIYIIYNIIYNDFKNIIFVSSFLRNTLRGLKNIGRVIALSLCALTDHVLYLYLYKRTKHLQRV